MQAWFKQFYAKADPKDQLSHLTHSTASALSLNNQTALVLREPRTLSHLIFVILHLLMIIGMIKL